VSTLVDERVVEMTFDNSNFEKNVKQSMNTIDNLKDSLDFSGTSEALNEGFKGINIAPLTEGLETVKNGFTTWEIVAITAISNITTRVMNLGEQMIKSLSIDNISSGWAKYGENVKSVGTLLSQDGNTVETVNTALEKLMWFTDQTSYSYTDMVSNISKFTATGQNLEDSVQAMMGIANWAALSGQNAQTASRAMYQLSQAMGQGTVKLMDYKSIQNANMDTSEFRENALNTAVAMGYLVKSYNEQGEALYTTTEKALEVGKTFSKSQFTTELSSGWFTSDVLMDTLSKYSKAVDKLYEDTELNGAFDTAAQAIEAYEQQLEETGTEEEKFGLKAFKAAQEARTFEDAINATKDAVSSGWLSTFDKVFGDYEESKRLWTDLADELWDVFAAGGEARNDILKAWKELGGRNDIFDKETGAFWNLFYAIKSVTDIVKQAWTSIFGLGRELKEGETYTDAAARNLKTITERIRDFTAKLVPSEETLNNLKNIFRGVFSILKVGIKIISALFTGLKPVFNLVGEHSGGVLKTLGDLGDKFANFVESTDIFNKAGSLLAKIITVIINAVKALLKILSPFIPVIKAVFNIFLNLFKLLLRIPGSIANFVKSMKGASIAEIFKSIGASISTAMQKISNALKSIGKKDAEGLGEFSDESVKKLSPLESIVKGIATLFEGLWNVIKAVMPIVGALFELIGEALSWIGEKLKNIFSGKSSIETFKTLFSAAFWGSIIAYGWWIIEWLRGFTGGFADVIQGFADVLDSKAMMQYAEAMKTFALALLIVVASLVLLGSMDSEELARAMATLTILVSGMMAVMKAFNNMFTSESSGFKKGILGIADTFKKSMELKAAATMMISFAAAIAIMALTLKILGTMSLDQIVNSLFALVALSTILVVVSKILAKDSRVMNRGMMSMVLFAIALRLLVKPIKVLGTLDEGALKQGLVSLAAIMAMLVVVSKILKTSNSANLGIFATDMVILSVGLMLMAGAIKIMSLLNPVGAVIGLAIMTALMGIFVGISKLIKIGQVAALTVFATAMVILGIAMNEAATAIAIMSLVPIGKAIASGLILGILMDMMVSISKNISGKQSAKMGIFAASMVILGIAMNEFALAMSVLGKMKVKSLAVAMIAMVGLIYILVSIAKTLSLKSIASIEVLGTALLTISVGMIALATAVALFGSMSWKTLGIGFGALVVALAALVVVSKLLGPGVLILLALGAAMLLISTAIMSLAAALFFLASATAVGAVAIEKLFEDMLDSTINLGPKIAKAAEVLIEALITALTEALDGIFEMVNDIIDEIVLLLKNKGPAVISTVMSLLTLLLEQLALNSPSIARSLVTILVSLLDALKEQAKRIIQDVIDILFILLDTIKENVPEYLKRLGAIVTELIDGVINFLLELIPRLIQAAFDLVLGLIDGLGQAIEDNAERVRETINRFCEHLWNAFLIFFGIKKSGGSSSKASGLGGNIISGLLTGILGKATKVVTALANIGKKLFKELKSWVTNFKTFGRNIIQGLIDGLKAMAQKVTDTVSNIGNTIKKKFKKLFKIGSPSRVFYEYGEWTMQGYINGLQSKEEELNNEAEDLYDSTVEPFDDTDEDISYDKLGRSIIDALSEAIIYNSGEFYKTINGLIDGALFITNDSQDEFKEAITNILTIIENEITEEDLVIRPVMDLTEIQNGTSLIAGMLASVDGYSISGSNKLAEQTSSEFNIANLSNDKTNDISATGNTNSDSINGQTLSATFNIYGSTDPKAVAEEVNKKLQVFVERRNKTWA